MGSRTVGQSYRLGNERPMVESLDKRDRYEKVIAALVQLPDQEREAVQMVMQGKSLRVAGRELRVSHDGTAQTQAGTGKLAVVT